MDIEAFESFLEELTASMEQEGEGEEGDDDEDDEDDDVDIEDITSN